jgi:hypothetical protein
MMDLIKKYQTGIAFVVIVAALFGAYQFFFATKNAPALTATPTAVAGPDQDLVALLFQLKGIRLDNTLFGDPLFQSLKDFGRDLVSEPIGRVNPFAPLEGVPVVTPTRTR